MNLAFLVLLMMVSGLSLGLGIYFWSTAIAMNTGQLVPRAIVFVSLGGLVLSAMQFGWKLSGRK